MVFDTPVNDLFTGTTEMQIEEAFYLTQVGGLFSCLIGLIVASYTCWYLSFETIFNNIKQDKIMTAFKQIDKTVLSVAERNALYRIQEIKLGAKSRTFSH